MLTDASWVPVILLRWIHVLCAALVIGGTFLMAFLLPWPKMDEATDITAPYLRGRRGFKRLVHVCALLLLISGIYNAYGNWGLYKLNRPLAHGLFGPHLLFGLLALAVLIVVLAHRAVRATERTWFRISVLLLFLAVLMASSLKYVRDHLRP